MLYSNEWSFYNPVRVISGPGKIETLPAVVKEELRKVESEKEPEGLLVTSPGFVERGQAARLKNSLVENGLPVEVMGEVKPNPDLADLEAWQKRYKSEGFNFLIGAGGGSAIDTAKALSLLLNSGADAFSLKEHFRGAQKLPDLPLLPLVAVPTTAGTGSEATNFATIWDLQAQKKYSLAKKDLFPRAALLDAGLTLSLPEETTVITGLDVLSHALESVWNVNAGPLNVALAGEAINIVLSILPFLIEDLGNLEYRSEMLTASLMGGICISTTRTALAHSISYPVTAALGCPHGLACAFTLPALLEYNAKDDDGRFQKVAGACGCRSVEELHKKITALFEQVGINKMLSKYGVTKDNVSGLIEGMFTPERAGNNLRPVDTAEVEKILQSSFHRTG